MIVRVILQKTGSKFKLFLAGRDQGGDVDRLPADAYRLHRHPHNDCVGCCPDWRSQRCVAASRTSRSPQFLQVSHFDPFFVSN